MKYPWFVLLGAFFATANAATIKVVDGEKKLVLTKKDCRKLVINHKPSGDVAYQSGKDVHGRDVAPADLGDTKKFKMPDTIELPLQMILGDVSSSSSNNPFVNNIYKQSYLQHGKVEIKTDGRVFLNGTPVHDEHQRVIQEHCRIRFPNL